jgi:hypothetical protein
MMSDGQRLAWFTQNFMSNEFKGTHVPAILLDCTGQHGTIDSIEELYDDSDESQKANLRQGLTDVNHWAWRVTSDGIKAICNNFLEGIDPRNVKLLQDAFEKLVLALSQLCEPRVLHLGFFGPPGVGKSTGAIQIVQAVLLGRFGAGRNASLGMQLQRQDYADERLMAMAELEPTDNYLFFNCTDTMTPAWMQGAFKEQFGEPSGLKICHWDEVDKIGAMCNVPRKKFMGVFQHINEGVIGDKKWFPTGTAAEDRVAPHVLVHVWSGNINWSFGADHQQAQHEVYLGLVGTVQSQKFDCSRMPEVSHIIPLL